MYHLVNVMIWCRVGRRSGHSVLVITQDIQRRTITIKCTVQRETQKVLIDFLLMHMHTHTKYRVFNAWA